MRDEKATVLANERLGEALYLITLTSPHLAAEIEAGQFVHLRVPAMADHILRRPFSIYEADAPRGVLEILYQVVGYGTDFMTGLAAGDEVALIGPAGRGWQPPQECKRALLVGGGVGAAPLFMLARKLRAEGVFCDVVLGAQTADALVCRERYESALERAPRCSTDDGTFGFEGFCTPLASEALAEAERAGEPFDYVAVCGPPPLMKLVAAEAAAHHVFCEVSLERRMACGVGACLSCVAETIYGRQRVCAYGPVFDASEVIW